MKSWLTFLLVGGGVVFAYNTWIAGDDDEEPIVVVDSEKPSEDPDPEAEAKTRERVDPYALEVGVPEPPEGEEKAVAPRPRGPQDKLLEEWRTALADGKTKAAGTLGKRILRAYPQTDAAHLVRYEEGRRELAAYKREGKTARGLARAHRARQLMTPVLFVQATPAESRAQLREVLGELAQAVLFSPRHVEGADFVYTPKRGDNLTHLCRRVFPKRGARVSPGLVAAVNGMARPSDLRAGEPIKVPKGACEIRVLKSEYRLYFLVDGAYAGDFPVGLGKDDSTPVAEFRIKNRQMNPDWYPKPGVKIPFGDPRNVLGTRWLGFENTTDYRGFGIHGTNDPGSIGKSESSGCIRMRQKDVERIFDWAPLGAVVRILP